MSWLPSTRIDPSKIKNVYSLLAVCFLVIGGPFGAWLVFWTNTTMERIIPALFLIVLLVVFFKYGPTIIESAQPEKMTSQTSSRKTEAPITSDELKDMANDVKEIKRTTEDIRFDLQNPLRGPGQPSQLNPFDANGVNREIDDAVKLLQTSSIEEAKRSLLKTLGKIEDKPKEFAQELARIYNNLGVCFNIPETEGGDLDKAEEYFIKSLGTKRYLQ